MRFKICKQVYKKSVDELGGGWYTEEKYRKYEIYDTKIEKWITTDEFVKIAQEKELK